MCDGTSSTRDSRGSANRRTDASEWSIDPGPWSEELIETATALSNLATGYVAMSQALDDATELNAQLQRALEVRVVVEQAKGILSERDGRPPGEAYERIRGHARDQQMTVRAVATAVVDGTLRP